MNATRFWGIELDARRLVEAGAGGTRSWSLDGKPSWLGYGDDGSALVALRRDEEHAVLHVLDDVVERGTFTTVIRRMFAMRGKYHAVLAPELGDVIVRIES